MLKTILNHLNAPFPDHMSVKQQAYWIFGAGLFIMFFIQMFDTPNQELTATDRLIRSITIGLVTICSASSFTLARRYIVKIPTDIPSWTLWKWIIEMLLLIAWIALGNLVYVQMTHPEANFTMIQYLAVLRGTLLVGVIPIIVSGLLLQIRADQKYKELAKQTLFQKRCQAGSDKEVKLKISQTENLRIAPQNILFIEAMQNYVSVNYWLNKSSDSHQRALIRDTLINVEKILSESPVKRCHRSYLVNIDAVEAVTGNAQGLKLKLQGLANMQVPVSRKYIAEIKSNLA